MKTSSAKAKGRRCAQEAKDLILDKIKILCPDDIVITSSGETGEDLKLSPLARTWFPFSVECKNTEKLGIWAAMKQAEGHGEHMPLLIYKRNRSDMYCSLKLEHLLELLR